jgi:hypothetical protein
MSMIEIGSTTPSTAALEADRRWWATAIARYTRIRRGQLDLTIARAAELSGLEESQWVGIEDGWVPEQRATLQAVATTLQVIWSDFAFVALFASCAQKQSS